MVAEVDRASSTMRTAKKNDLYVHDGKYSTYHVWKIRMEASLQMEGVLDVALGKAPALPKYPTYQTQ